MSITKEFGWELYGSIERISDYVVEGDIDSLLEQAFDEKARHGLSEYNSKTDHMLGNFGLSYLVADTLAKDTGDIFYDHRKEDFREFVETTRTKSSGGYTKPQLIQFNQLYTNVAEDLDIETPKYPGSLFTPPKNKEDIADATLELIEDIADALEN